MADANVVPQIRFKGFTDPWEQRKLGDVATIVGGGTPSTNNSAYWDGDIDWYSPAELGEQVYADRSVRRITQAGYDSCSATLLPAGKTILFTSRAGIGNTAILRRSACTNQGFQSLVMNDGTDVYFVYSMTDQIKKFAEQKASGSTFLEISGKGLAAGEFAFPSKDEQAAIGSMFKQLDSLITLHQRKCDKLSVVKKALLEKMFPKEGEVVPEIRFKGFTDPWEQRKLGELYRKNEERNDDGLGPESTLSVATMTYSTEGNGAAESSLPNYKRVRPGDIAFEGHTNKEFAFGRFVLNDAGQGIMSPRFSCLRPIVAQDFQFWKRHIHRESSMRRVLINSTKSGTMMNELVVEEFFDQSLPVPSLSEQRAIGALFSRLDSLITLHQRELETLKNVKKALLEKMFV